MRKLFLIPLLSLFLVSCGGLQYAQFPNEFQDQGKKVKATIKHSNVLGFTPMTNTFKLMEALSKKCAKVSNGNVENVTVEVIRKNVLGFVLVTEMTAYGNCCCEEEQK